MKVSVKDKNKLFVYFCELNKVLNNSWLFGNFNTHKVHPKFLSHACLLESPQHASHHAHAGPAGQLSSLEDGQSILTVQSWVLMCPLI